jgi:hypothetical protein
MRRFTRAFYVALGVAWLVPVFVYAQTAAGLVPCTGLNCEACSLAQLIQNIINYAIGISIPLFVLLLAWVGVLYFTAAANPSNIEKAKKILKQALIGFLITLTAWLVINTLLVTILNKQWSSGSWFSIQCVGINNRAGTTPQNSSTVQGLLNSLPALNSSASWGSVGGSVGNVGTNAYACPTGYQLAGSGDTGTGSNSAPPTCYNPTTNDVQDVACQSGYSVNANGFCQNDATGQVADPTAVLAAPLTTGNSGACDASAVQAGAAAGGYTLTSNQAAGLACLAQYESVCGSNIQNYNWGNGSSAYGAFQVTLQQNYQAYNNNACDTAIGLPAGTPLNCNQGFSGGNSLGNTTSQQCMKAAANLSCSSSAAAYMLNTQGSSAWTADSNSSKQASCISQYNI